MGEETGADFAVGGEADAAAGAAEGEGDGRDDADLADAVVEGVAACGLAGVRCRAAARSGRTALMRVYNSS